MSVVWTRLWRKDAICPVLFFYLWVYWELHDHRLPLWKTPWWQWLCSHMETWFLSYQEVISELPLEADGIFLNSLHWFIHHLISLGYNLFRFTALFQGGWRPKRLICYTSSHCKSKAVPCWETPNAQWRGHLAAWVPEISGAALHQSSCFSWKEKNPHFKVMWQGIAKNKPEDLREHNGPSTANVVVPKCGFKACSKATCNTANQFGNAIGSQLRAQKDGFRLNPCPKIFRTSSEAEGWRTGPF